MSRASGHIERWGTMFYVLCVAVVAWQCFMVALDTQLGGLGQLFHNWHVVAISLANALLLLSPYWLLRRRWRWLVWIPLTLLTVWCLMQVCYCRAYDDLMPWQSLTLTQNVNSTLAATTLSLLRWQDLLILVPYLLLVAVCLLGRRTREDGERLKPFLLSLAGGLILSMAGYLVKGENYEKRFLHNFSNRGYFAQNGMIPYGAFSLYQALFNNHKVTDEERAMVDRFLAEDCPNYTDNPYSVDGRRNLVLIIVESLHTWPIGMQVDGREVTPVMNSLVAGDSVIYAPHVLFQTSHGHSSDAHFIYNTGLLPLRDGVVAVHHGDGPYPTLAAALPGYDCREIICTPGVNWNQNVTARTYGFDTLYTREHLAAALKRQGNIDDAALMDYAGGLLPSLHQPFFLEMVTMTMHAPYTDGKLPPSWITTSDTLNAEARGYLNCVHLTDSCIGVFINDLHRHGLAGNTVLAIVSDHTQLYRNRVMGISDYDAVPDDWGIPLIIAGCDTTLRYDAVIGQVDVYPTLLDVMGANAYPWKGLGHSILRYPVAGAIQPRNMSVIGDSTAITRQQRKAWDISRLLIFDRVQRFSLR
ncbi:MAG: LTA synthase family protein [Muribaculaceae bacterium]|nr:LTA synthase family protein [Muribaculaceae bacterium]